MKNRKNKKGFTIVELVIVIGVIGILSAILIPTFSSLVNQAKETQRKADLAAAYSMYVADAADGYFGENTNDSTKKFDGELRGQQEVALMKDTKYFVYDATSGWDTTELTAAPTGKAFTAIVYGKTAQNSGTSVTYGGYQIFWLHTAAQA